MQKLPPYALPTHDVVLRGVIPTEFEVQVLKILILILTTKDVVFIHIWWMQRNTVAYDEGQKLELEKKLLLEDAISDLPDVCFKFYYYYYYLILFLFCPFI